MEIVVQSNAFFPYCLWFISSTGKPTKIGQKNLREAKNDPHLKWQKLSLLVLFQVKHL